MENGNSEELSAASAAAAARRRRILENTNKRLGKITGRVHDEEIPKVESEVVNDRIYPDPELERDIFEANTTTTYATNGIPPNQDVFELLKTLQGNGISQDALPNEQHRKNSETIFSRVIRSKISITIIALLVYSLHVLNLERFIGSSVFGLLVMWEIFEFFMTSFIINDQAPTQNQIFVLISMFLGINLSRLQLIMKLFGFFNKILRDIAIFLFTFVFLHLTFCFGYKGESLNEILDKDFNILFSSKNDEF